MADHDDANTAAATDQDGAPAHDTSPPDAADATSPRDPGAPVDALEDGDKDAVFEALWKRTLEAWDDDKPHAAVLAHALGGAMLPELAGRYRALKDDPDKGSRAQKKIDGIVVAATQMLMATKTPPRTKTPWQWNVTAAAIFALVCAFLFYKLFIER